MTGGVISQQAIPKTTEEMVAIKDQKKERRKSSCGAKSSFDPLLKMVKGKSHKPKFI